MDQEEFNRLLAAILEPDTARVKEATAKLKKDYYTNPKCLGLLFQLLISDEPFQLRQLAATQARNLIPKHWPEVPDAHKSGIRTHLLQTTLTERDSRVRHASARVIGAIAQTDLAEGEWLDLPEQMIQAATSSNVQEREVSTYLLYVIVDDMPEEQSSHFTQFFEIFHRTIRDPESGEVRINTLLALSKMAQAIDSENDEHSLQNFHQAIPGMVEVLQQAIESKDDHRMTQCFEAFQELFEPDAKILGKYFGDLVQLMAGIAASHDMDKEPRTQALNFLMSAVLYRKLRFQGLRIGDKIVAIIMDILVHADEVDDTDEFSLTLSAVSLLNLMASQLPPSQVIVPILDVFKKYCASSKARERQAGISALSTCFEGAPEFFDTQLHDVIPRLLALLNDSDIKVRESAARGTKELAETLPEALSKDHQSFMSALAKNLTSAVQNIEGSEAKTNNNIAVHCCCAIDAMVHGLSPKDVTAYLPELVPHLSRLFSHPEAKIKSSAIGAVGAIAESSKEAFVPYFEQTMKSLYDNLSLKESEEDLDLRSMTIDSMGGMAEAVGPEAFKPYVQPLMQATEENLHLDDPRLKETSYMFWSAMARVYKEDFEPFLPGVAKSILEALEQDDGPGIEVEAGEQSADLIGQEVFIAGKRVKVVNGDTENGMEDGDDNDSEWDDLDALTPISEEKEVALEALAEVFSHVGSTFLPYYEKSIEIIMTLIEHHYEATRRAAISAMYRAYASLWLLQPDEQQKWEPGLPVKVHPTTEVAKLGEVVMTATMAQYMTEEDSAIILDINRNLGDTLKLTGPSLISGGGVLESITQILLSIITKQHSCQQEADDSDLSDDEGSEDDFYIIETALDAIAALAAVLGPQFGELWKIFAKPFTAYASASASPQRSATVGSLADVIRGMKSGITPFAAPLLKLLLHRVGDEDAQVKSNAAFAVGVLVQHADNTDADDLVRAYPTILGKLEPLLREGAEPRQLDNAAGCVARLITKRPDAVPLSEVLPSLVGLLPLKVDFEENAPVWKMLVGLYRTGDETILELSDQVVPALEEVLGSPEEQLEDETREELGQLIKFLYGRERALVERQPGLMELVRKG